MREFEVKVSSCDFGVRTGLLFILRENGKTLLAKPVELVFEPVKEGETIKPTLEMDSFTANEMLKALANGLQKSEIYPDKESQVKGELNATKYHLEDMRKLLKVKQ